MGSFRSASSGLIFLPPARMSNFFSQQRTTPFDWNFKLELERLDSVYAQALNPVAASGEDQPFQCAHVALSHDSQHLYITAELKDQDIFNRATQINERTWQMGDVFEIFLRPESQDAYYEFHVTPENQIMQVRFDSAADYELMRQSANNVELFQKRLLPEKKIQTQTAVHPSENCWQVLASIPFSLICEQSPWKEDLTWLVSFCRYDYTRGDPKPVLSSTSSVSPLETPNFHDQKVWRRLIFNSEPPLL